MNLHQNKFRKEERKNKKFIDQILKNTEGLSLKDYEQNYGPLKILEEDGYKDEDLSEEDSSSDASSNSEGSGSDEESGSIKSSPSGGSRLHQTPSGDQISETQSNRNETSSMMLSKSLGLSQAMQGKFNFMLPSQSSPFAKGNSMSFNQRGPGYPAITQFNGQNKLPNFPNGGQPLNSLSQTSSLNSSAVKNNPNSITGKFSLNTF